MKSASKLKNIPKAVEGAMRTAGVFYGYKEISPNVYTGFGALRKKKELKSSKRLFSNQRLTMPR